MSPVVPSRALFVHSKSDDGIDAALSRGVDEIFQHLAVVASPSPVVLIDGRSGAGKTSLSRRLRTANADVHVLALDSVYPGWDGLRAGADQVLESVLRPRALGNAGSWTGWDWEHHVPAATHVIPAGGVLVVEGVGILTPESAALANVRVWVDAPDVDRKRRALQRDGDTYAPHWERWARQEEEHIATHDPAALADVLIVVPSG